MMPKLRGRPSGHSMLVIAVVILLNVTFFIYARSSSDRRDDSHPSYGDRFSDVALSDIDGRPIVWRDKWLLLLQFDHTVPDSLRLAKYVEVLHARYARGPLVTVGVTRGQKGAIRAVLADANISYPVSTTSASALGFDEHTTWALLVDPDRVIRFSSDFVQPNDLRMILERYIAGTITYNPAADLHRLEPGDQVPTVTSAALGQDVSDRRGLPVLAGQSVIVFSARCSACSLTSALSNYVAWEKTSNVRPMLMFSTKFTRRELDTQLTQLKPIASAWQALEAIPGIEDPYSLDGLFPTDVIVVTSDANNRVSHVESWPDFVTRATAERGTQP